MLNRWLLTRHRRMRLFIALVLATLLTACSGAGSSQQASVNALGATAAAQTQLSTQSTAPPSPQNTGGSTAVASTQVATTPQGNVQGSSVDWNAVSQAIGVPGKLMDGETYRINMPRRDMQVTVGDVAVKPGLALGSWIAFKLMGNQTMMMGDLVLTEAEVNPVLAQLQELGIQQTALHKHLPGETPRIWWMHIMGHGDPVTLAKNVRTALQLTATPLTPPPSAASPSTIDLGTAAIDAALGRKGTTDGGIYKFSIGRADTVTQDGITLNAALGVATALNFQPTGGGKAAINGDFVMLAEEVNPVLDALRKNKIQIVELHNHGLTEQPHLYYAHFWANDDAVTLAKGLRAALDQTNSAKPTP
jgi:hypothetical protein